MWAEARFQGAVASACVVLLVACGGSGSSGGGQGGSSVGGMVGGLGGGTAGQSGAGGSAGQGGAAGAAGQGGGGAAGTSGGGSGAGGTGGSGAAGAGGSSAPGTGGSSDAGAGGTTGGGDGGADPCTAALPLQCGDRLNHSTTVQGRANLWVAYARTQRAESGRETVYAFSSASACKVVVNLKNLTTDLDLFLLSACDPIRSNTAFSSTPLDLQTVETVSWTSVPGKTDYVVVDGYGGAEGSYTLEVDCVCE